MGLVIGAALLLWAAGIAPWPEFRTLFVVLGLLLLAFGSVTLYLWIMHNFTEEHRKRATAKAETSQVLLVRELRNLSPETATAFLESPEALAAELYIIVGDDNAVYLEAYLNANGTFIPLAFAREFINNCNHAYLYPISKENDSKRRDMANAITDLLVEKGLASEAVGNKPARWRVSYRAVLNSFDGYL